MNIKFKSLKNKILLLSLNIILFIAIIICFAVYYQYNIKSADNILCNLSTLEKEIVKLKATEHDFLLNYKGISELYIASDTPFENEFSTIKKKINTITDSIEDFRLLRNDPDITGQIQKLKEILEFYSDNFHELVLVFKEKGAGLIGVTGEWQDISTSMIDKYSAFTDNPVYIQLLKLKNTERDYLLNKNPVLIDELSDLSNEIQSLIIMALNEEIELPDISDEIYNYIEKAKQLSNLDKRTGFQFNTGILYNLNSSFKELEASVSGLYLMAENRTASRQKALLIVLVLIIILLLSGLIIMIRISFRKCIMIPLNKILNYIEELVTGRLPDEKIKLKVNNEFSTLSESVNSLTEKFREKLKYTQNINKGKLDSELNILSEDDLLGKELIQIHKNIQESADEHERHNMENARRRYINEGLAKFSEILRLHNDDIEKLSDIFIKELVKYMNAVQGGLFLINNSEKKEQTLSLISAFAFNRKKYIEKEIKVGEGLVGTCAIEKKTISLTEIPEDYISITSGLGDAPPSNLLLLPVIQEDEILGVLEIASLNQFQEHEIDIGEQVTASLASTVTTAKNNEQTAQLLSKSQIQAQEMLEQEEEMRQNMEELKATQEEASRREEEHRGLINAVDQSTYMVEYDLDGNIIKINEKFLMFLGKTREELIGNKHISLGISGSKTKVDTKFWDKLKETNHKVISENITVGKKKEYKVMQIFSTINNIDGVPVKFLNLVIDITSVIKE